MNANEWEARKNREMKNQNERKKKVTETRSQRAQWTEHSVFLRRYINQIYLIHLPA